jgi:hypothetical protein
MQQAETQLKFWAPSRVRFNLTLILAAAVILFGIYQLITEARSGDPPPAETGQVQDGQPGAGDEAQQSGRRGGGSWLLIVVGIGVGAYSWLTSPRQYRIYSDALVIMFGTPRNRSIHFSQIQEAVNDRGFMGDPLRVYTINRRRIAIQVRDPEEFHAHLDSAMAEFRRAYPQFAPPPREDDGGEAAPTEAPFDVVDSSADETEIVDSPSADADGGDANSGGSRGSQRRSLRDDGYDSNGDDERPRFS